MNLATHQLQALRLIQTGQNGGLTHRANILISQQAQSLLAAHLINYAPNSHAAYRLTVAGTAALKELKD